MSLVNKIEVLQKKPEALRRKVLLISVAVIMFVVIALWVSTIKLSIQDNAEKENSAASPFSVVSEMVKDGYNASKDLIK